MRILENTTNEHNWRPLLSHSIKPSRSVLSVYLDVDQSSESNLNRGFEKQFKDMMSSLRTGLHDSAELARFKNAEHRLADFLKAYKVGGRTLVMFFEEPDEFFWHQEVEIPIRNLARWDRQIVLAPLAAATDDFERYGVLLADRANVRLFTVYLGEIEEVARQAFDPMKVRHIKTVGTDHSGSASRVQKKADQQVRKNLRQGIKDLDSLVGSKHVDRVVLAGTSELTSELKDLLPKRIAPRIIGALDLDADAPLRDVLDATLSLTQKYERDTEEQLAGRVATSAAKGQHAVAGLSKTLKKINESRVWQLLYSEDFHAPGFECGNCAALFSSERPACLYCGAALLGIDDVVERAVERALRSDAKIEIVRGEAAASLDSAGGIGAFLRARTSSLRE